MEIINSVNLRPKVGSVYSHAWDVMKKQFLPLFLILIILGVANMPLSMVKEYEHHDEYRMEIKEIESFKLDDYIEFHRNHRTPPTAGMILLNIFAIAYALFVLNPIKYGADFMRLKAVRNQKFEVKEIFDVFKNYLNVVLAALLSISIIVIGFVFLIIPGIIFACRLAFVPYLVMDKKIDPVKAVEESWRLTKGYGWRIFGMGLLALPIAIAGVAMLVVGLIPAIIWITAAFASMYHAVMLERGEYQTETIEEA
jgi:uncharacterized membrane protein